MEINFIHGNLILCYSKVDGRHVKGQGQSIGVEWHVNLMLVDGPGVRFWYVEPELTTFWKVCSLCLCSLAFASSFNVFASHCITLVVCNS